MKATPSRKPTTPSATRSLISLPSSPTREGRARFQGYRFGCVQDGGSHAGDGPPDGQTGKAPL
jgi:hypothetical protein